MEAFALGRLIYQIRIKAGLKKKQIATGLCPTAMLDKIEADFTESEPFLANMLMQRLAVSSHNMEYILTKPDYQWLDAQDLFMRLIFRGRGEPACHLLSYLEKLSTKSPTQEMHIHRFHALYQYYIAHNKALAAKELAETLLLTSPFLLNEKLPVKKWMERYQISGIPFHSIQGFLLSSTELENLLAFVRILNETGNILSEDAIQVLEWCREYIDSHMINREEHARIFCKCTWLLAGFYLNTKDKASLAFELCDSAFEELQDYGISYFMFPLLRRMLQCNPTHALQRKKEKYQRYLNTLTHLYDTFGKPWYPQDSILYDPHPYEYFLDYEVLQGGRKTLGLTQETMSLHVFEDSRSVSQIETLKSKPNKDNFRKLMENLHLQKTRCNGFVLTDSAEMLEHAQELRRLISKNMHIEMERCIRELRSGIDMTVRDNQYAIRYFENVIDYSAKNREYKDVLREDYEMLRETYDIKGDLYRPPFMLEADFINQIAILLRRMGRAEEAAALYEKVLETYHKSKVKVKYHFSSYSVMLGNLAARKESLELSENIIQLSLKCGKINLLHFSLMTYLCALEETKDADKKYCRAILKDIITLCELVKNEKDLIIARQYYEKNYDEE